MVYKRRITDNPPQTLLCELFYKYGADKCPQVFHSYSTEYYKLLKEHKNEFKNILEIGIGSYELMSNIAGETYQIGASLRAWRDFFINGKIYGLDINKNILFEDERIKCFFTDQSDEVQLNNTIYEIRKYENNNNLVFDLIIDDGSHLINHQILSLHIMFKYLKSGGLYIIEDINKSNIKTFQNLDIPDGQIIETYISTSHLIDDAFIVVKKF